MKPYKPLFEHYDHEEEEKQPQPEDIGVSNSGPLGSKYSVGVFEGKFIGEFDTVEEVNDAIDSYCKSHKYWPDVWFEDDHGGYHPWREN